MRKLIIPLAITILAACSISYAGDGGGTIKLGYTYLEEDGNRSVNFPTFNEYQGVNLSLEDFRYNFDNGLRFSADLNNITLENRRGNIGLEKSRVFGINLSHNKYRRIYDFDNEHNTERNHFGASAWIQPHKYIKIFGGGNLTDMNGSVANLFDTGFELPARRFDYRQTSYNAGLRIKHKSRMVQVKYETAEYEDDASPERNQSRYRIKTNALLPVPRYEWIVLSGGFRHFETEYDSTGFKISSNTGWGEGSLYLPRHFILKYSFLFNRASSDSDYVATDNITHAVYLSHYWKSKGAVTVGYRHLINDDYEDEVTGKGGYISGWFAPSGKFKLRADIGISDDEVKEGSRLIGDEQRNKYRLSAKYRHNEETSLSLQYSHSLRENEQLDTEADYYSIGLDATAKALSYGWINAGYTYSKGDYQNIDDRFEFIDHLIYGDLYLNEYHDITPGAGIVYYRSKRDLDVESIRLRFSLIWNFYRNFNMEAVYNVHNFDDFLFRDKYYTANIVEINILNEFSF
ncbi:MAG: hypothetical protein GF307_03925 [candidate division Zixibacteria bacterium]|nr:hypothetical protein [candidate division Zixibacteria bacterium]